VSLLAKRRGNEEADLNVTSLVDVTMTVLIMFILIAPVLEQGMKIEHPASDAVSSAEIPDEPLVISLTKSKDTGYGVVKLGDAVMGPEKPFDKLYQTLCEMKAKKNDLSVIIRADGDFPYEYVIRLMDAAYSAGVAVGLGDK
jgi:biopolymer transport protein ExbD